MIFGVLEKPSLKSILDLTPREIAVLAPLFLLTIYYGVHPGPILDGMSASVAQLIHDNSEMRTAALALPVRFEGRRE